MANRNATRNADLKIVDVDAAGGVDDEEDVTWLVAQKVVVEVLRNVVGVFESVVILIW